jgi:hypothetical protein
MKVQCRHCGSGTWVVNDAGDTRCTECGRDLDAIRSGQISPARVWRSCEPCPRCAAIGMHDGVDGNLLCSGCYAARARVGR